jgi:hypothetical protein
MANGLKCSVCGRVHVHYYDRQRCELPASRLFRAYVDRARAHARSGRGKRDATHDLTRLALDELRALCSEHARVCDRWGELQALAAHGLERELVWQRVKDAARFEEFETLAEFRRLARPGRLEHVRRTLGTVDDAAMRFFGAPSADELFWAVVRSGSYGLPIAPADSTWPSALEGAVASGYYANIHGGPSYLFSGDRNRQRTNAAFARSYAPGKFASVKEIAQ